jgi:hypothetical protein
MIIERCDDVCVAVSVLHDDARKIQNQRGYCTTMGHPVSGISPIFQPVQQQQQQQQQKKRLHGNKHPYLMI